MLKDEARRITPCTSYPLSSRKSVRYEPSCPVMPVISATLREGSERPGSARGLTAAAAPSFSMHIRFFARSADICVQPLCTYHSGGPLPATPLRPGGAQLKRTGPFSPFLAAATRPERACPTSSRTRSTIARTRRNRARPLAAVISGSSPVASRHIRWVSRREWVHGGRSATIAVQRSRAACSAHSLLWTAVLVVDSQCALL